MTAEKNVKMGAELAGNKDYNEVIKAVGLEGKKNKYPSELSGGEQQRVSIARAISKKPKVLFMDEFIQTKSKNPLMKLIGEKEKK